jgi:hypothetical protein
MQINDTTTPDGGQPTSDALENPEHPVPNDPEYQSPDPITGSRSAECRPRTLSSRLINDGSSAPHVSTPSLWQRLLQMVRSSPQSSLVVRNCAPCSISSPYQITMSTRAIRRRQIEGQAKQVRLKVAKVQLGVWYRRQDALPSQGRTFSIEYERDFLQNGVAYIHLVYEYGLVRIDVSGNF